MARARALFRFDAAQAGDLSFAAGEEIVVTKKGEDGWWTGRTLDGRVGVFPWNRVELLANAQPQAPVAMSAPPSEVTDRLQQVTVTPVEPIQTVGTKFNIIVQLFSGSVVKATKSMTDFRTIAHAMNQITNQGADIVGFDHAEGREVVLPEWSDNMSYPDEHARALLTVRGNILTSFLQNIYNELESEGAYLMVYWMDPNYNFSLNANRKRKMESSLHTGAQQAVRARAQLGPDPQMAKALYRWVRKDDADNIEFLKGEILAFREDSEYQGWWIGTKINGDTGLFPFNYVTPLGPAESSRILHPNSPGITAPENAPAKIVLEQPADKSIEFDNFTPTHTGEPRKRQKITKYTLCCTEAFDELLTRGVTIEENGKLAMFDGVRDTPQKGDTVILHYSAFLWEPQKQELLEFSAHDNLVNSSPNSNTGPLRFAVGEDQAIDGIDEAVCKMSLGQTVRVTLAPEKAYGEVGNPPDVPGNAYLVYDITLKDIQRDSKNVMNNVGGAKKNTVMVRPKHEQRAFKGAASMRQMRNTPARNAPAGVGPEHFKKKLTLVQLQEIVQMKKYSEYGINPALIEEYLTETEFDRAFKMPYEMFLLLPATRRRDLKKQARIF